MTSSRIKQQAEGDEELIFLGAPIERPQQQRLDHDADQRDRAGADRDQQKRQPDRHAERDTRAPTSQAVTKAPTA